jgi:hypothetical protein
LKVAGGGYHLPRFLVFPQMSGEAERDRSVTALIFGGTLMKRCIGVVIVLSAILLSVDAPLARSQTPGAAALKSPSTARAIAFFIPGGGHVYAGEPIRGFALMAAFAGAATWGISTSHTVNVDYTCQVRNCTDKSQNPDYTRLGVGLGIAGAAWLVSFVDAGNAANRANDRDKRVAIALGRVSLEPVAIRRGSTVRTGLQLRFGF